MNIYENLINKEKKEKLIKVKKRDGNEDRFNFENKIMDNESYYHKMKKNKTTTRFNYTKSSINSQNNKKEGLNENILRNKKIKKKIIIYFFWTIMINQLIKLLIHAFIHWLIKLLMVTKN